MQTFAMGARKMLASRTFECTIYCVKWLSDGEHCIIGGGGGRSSEISNRLVRVVVMMAPSFHSTNTCIHYHTIASCFFFTQHTVTIFYATFHVAFASHLTIIEFYASHNTLHFTISHYNFRILYVKKVHVQAQ